MDPNVVMETAGHTAEAATKLGEIIEKMFGPRWTRKQADADAYADQKKLQTIRENQDMDIVYIEGQLNARLRTPEVLAYRAQQRMNADMIRQENNVEKVLEIADCELSKRQQVSDESVDDDWVARFFSIVKDISNEEMQYIWGRILAGEIASPQSFSLRTLDILRNISGDEARIFQQIIPYITYNNGCYFILADMRVLQKYEIPYSYILLLDECGLMNSDAGLSLDIQVSNGKEQLIVHDRQTIIVRKRNTNDERVSASIFTLTRVGQEFYNILSHTSSDDNEKSEEYIKELAQYIFEHNRGKVIVSVHEVVNMERDGHKGRVQIEGPPIVVYGEEITST